MPMLGFIGHALQERRKRSWIDRKGSDAKIIVGDRSILVHSTVLAAESPYLAENFRDSLRRGESRDLHVEDTDLQTVCWILHLIYFGESSMKTHQKVYFLC